MSTDLVPYRHLAHVSSLSSLILIWHWNNCSVMYKDTENLYSEILSKQSDGQ